MDESAPSQRYALTVEYVGTAFHGSQQQSVGPTVQEDLEAALVKLTPHAAHRPIAVFAGRTDAGVHASGASVHVDLVRGRQGEPPPPPFTEAEVLNALNHSLRSARVGVVAARRVPRSYHAQLSACMRTYVYSIRSGAPAAAGAGHALRSDSCPSLCQRGWISALDAHRALCLAEHLDVGAMRAAAAELEGLRDFSSVRAPKCTGGSPVRRLVELSVVVEQPDALGELSVECPVRISVRARSRAFLKNQVRLMVAVLLEAGRGRMTADDVRALMDARDARRCPPAAAAHGLYLARVAYPPEAFAGGERLFRYRDPDAGAACGAGSESDGDCEGVE